MSSAPSTVERTLQERQLKFTLPEKPALPNLCDLARDFEADCQPLLEKAEGEKTELAVNVALLQLQHKYFAYYASAPAGHRKHGGPARRRGSHSCLFDVYRHCYEALNRIRLELNPPPLRPPPPPPAPQPQLQGTILGLSE